MPTILDKHSFEIVFRSNYEALCRSAYRIVQDEISAEDIVQDVFCRLWNNRQAFDLSETIKSYLFRSVINESISYLRRQKNKSGRENTYFSETGNDNSTDELIAFKEAANRINQLIALLPTACRTIFVLSRFEGFTYKQIASELNISVKTVENQMVKALKFMRRHMVSVTLFLLFTFFLTGT